MYRALQRNFRVLYCNVPTSSNGSIGQMRDSSRDPNVVCLQMLSRMPLSATLRLLAVSMAHDTTMMQGLEDDRSRHPNGGECRANTLCPLGKFRVFLGSMHRIDAEKVSRPVFRQLQMLSRDALVVRGGAA